MSEHLKRGNLLWEGSRMFLPEHKKALIERKQEQQKVKKPHLDEQQLEKIDQTICEAIARNKKLCFTYCDQGELKQLSGYVHDFDERHQELHIADDSGQAQNVPQKAIIDCHIL